MTQPEDYRQPHHLEMVQLIGNLEELEKMISQLKKKEISLRLFSMKANDLIKFLKAVAGEISTTFEGLLGCKIY